MDEKSTINGLKHHLLVKPRDLTLQSLYNLFQGQIPGFFLRGDAPLRNGVTNW